MLIQKKVLASRQGNPRPLHEKKPSKQVSLPVIHKENKPQKTPRTRPSKRSSAPTAVVVNTKPDESMVELAKRLLGLPRQGDHNCGSVFIKFNHYNRSFPIYNGVLQWIDVDKEYCFSFVYRGNYTRNVFPRSQPVMETDSDCIRVPMRRDASGDYFVDLITSQSYEVLVEEDPIAGVGAEGLRTTDKPLFASSRTPMLASGNAATRQLTQDLLDLPPDQLGSTVAMDIIARRDIEDVMFA
ncbi:hypothetical protein LEN26_017129 [Aphanomyces euteiches]|nr:hypothetical protein LEN26_017129 [Aphanomyces euteiches]KAH9128254.1 hypothetical protein AeMF1_001579 [Aphanomyces euteiches]KAH9186068.1 hypothetical protein AeNC1_011960 [Aphanomyces euteiches]